MMKVIATHGFIPYPCSSVPILRFCAIVCLAYLYCIGNCYTYRNSKELNMLPFPLHCYCWNCYLWLRIATCDLLLTKSDVGWHCIYCIHSSSLEWNPTACKEFVKVERHLQEFQFQGTLTQIHLRSAYSEFLETTYV